MPKIEDGLNNNPYLKNIVMQKKTTNRKGSKFFTSKNKKNY